MVRDSVAGRKVGASLWLTIVHDWSKFRPCEWMPYAFTFYNSDGTTRYNETPEFMQAWLHHQHHNKHHWQYWVLRADNGKTEALKMPHKYMLEMVADWMGAGRAIHGEWECARWYMTNKHKIVLHPDTQAEIERLLLNDG